MELRPIDRTDRGRARLNAALAIYRDTILPEAQNPERQILYWIDHSHDDLADQFRCFALQRDREVVGYLQYSYFREEHTFFFEYLCIQDARISGLVPSDAVKTIEDYLVQNYRPDFTMVFEVARKRAKAGDWHPDAKLIRYFKRLGFRTVDFDYHYPILQSYDGATSYPADLMVRMAGGRTVISSSEMRTILRCIYFKHYLRWDRPFLEPERFSERERLIDELYSKQVSRIGPDDKFGTRGDDKRLRTLLRSKGPHIRTLMAKVFGPKLPRLFVVLVLTMVIYRITDSVLGMIATVLAAAALYCLAEDTEASRKLFVAIMSRLSLAKLRP